MTVNLQEWLETAVEAAFSAGDVIVKVGADSSSIEKDIKTKSNDGDFVTIADRSAQRVIFSVLTGQFPQLKIVGEEVNCEGCSPESSSVLCSSNIEERISSISTLASDCGLPHTKLKHSPRSLCSKSMCLAREALQEYDEDSPVEQTMSCHKVPHVPCSIDLPVEDCIVFVDPLDGTFNFVHGCLFGVGVSIGLTYKGQAIAGVMFYPFFSKKLLHKYNFPKDLHIYMDNGALLHPFHAQITELKKQHVPIDLFFGAQYGDYCNCNLTEYRQTLWTSRLSQLSESKPFSEHYFQIQNMSPDRLNPLLEWIDKQTDETHIKIRSKDGLQTFYGALCKFREFLLGLGGCFGVIYIDGFLKPWDICAFMGIAHSLNIDVYTKEPRPLTLSKSSGSAYVLKKGYLFKPDRKGNIPFFITADYDSTHSGQLAAVSLDIANSLESLQTDKST
ncbi:Myo-inositol-1(or 4)-monophosphatase [Giardia duodenalis]|uniref:3'(2'),5'-bisphosphate nucleotidase n=1 Tax=Giardia intestinalis TaxID=5741 RepID=V6TA05_GIAIN|nr:Myo-inositol-1(or 4)-monophosphatase [Giardia intestinalis]